MTEKEFKIGLATGIKELSECMSSEMEPIKPGILVKITNYVYRRIVMEGFPVEIEPYNKAIDSVINGGCQFYKLNVINLMAIFRSGIIQPDILGYNETYINGKRMFNRCIEIPRGTKPCPSNMYHWNPSKKEYVYGN